MAPGAEPSFQGGREAQLLQLRPGPHRPWRLLDCSGTAASCQTAALCSPARSGPITRRPLSRVPGRGVLLGTCARSRAHTHVHTRAHTVAMLTHTLVHTPAHIHTCADTQVHTHTPVCTHTTTTRLSLQVPKDRQFPDPTRTTSQPSARVLSRILSHQSCPSRACSLSPQGMVPEDLCTPMRGQLTSHDSFSKGHTGQETNRVAVRPPGRRGCSWGSICLAPAGPLRPLAGPIPARAAPTPSVASLRPGGRGPRQASSLRCLHSRPPLDA